MAAFFIVTLRETALIFYPPALKNQPCDMFRFFFRFLSVILLNGVLFTTPSHGEPPEDDFLSLGGALRFNYNLSSWKPGQQQRGGDFGYDMFRINVLGAYQGIRINAEYRLYSEGFGGGMLKQGWLAFDPHPGGEIQLGLNQVPFGIQQYNSHNWFFNLTYYLGFEDDHDMGIKYILDRGRWQWQAAWYLSAEELVFDDVEASPRRYSYDVTGRNKENNQLNLKGIRRLGASQQWEVGASLQGGLLYNLDTQTQGERYAWAVHAEHKPVDAPWGLKVQYLHYRFQPANAADDSRDVVTMGAYGANYLVAAAGNIFTFCLSWHFDLDIPLIDGITIYNDFGYLQKPRQQFDDTYMNVTGFLLSAGRVFVYTDWAMGYNHPWLGPEWTNALAAGDADAGWHRRFNINIGYYF
jgi:hypothetical protein